MNVDSQFPQPLAPEPLQRPIAKPVEQVITRPVDNSKSAEAANNKSEKDSARARSDGQNTRGDEAAQTPRSENQLSEEDKAKLDNLRARDREVRAHEAAHKSAAGSYAKGSAQFTFDEGPDGKRYAVGGEVSIDTSKINGDPAATIQKAQTIRRAANAPAQPSGQDRSVAAQATQMESEARGELSAERSVASEETRTEPASPAERIQNAGAEPAPVGELIDVLA
ncbi:SrpA-related protein [hydrothermal vent metagenome]|uniref:SrpA-related protein n=1 Tax=hydrothermal vent metagenome TaxID=652676 RepID=A0A3B0YIJ3_9ZZZZ